MPSKSFAQARLMAGASHDPVFAKKVGVPMKTAKEFNKADTRSKFLKSAMRARGPAYAEGGEISPAQRSQDFLDRFDEDRARESARKEETARTRKPRSDRRNPDRATITKGIPMPPPPPPPPPAPPVTKYARGGRTQVSAETSGLRGGNGPRGRL